MRNMPNWEGFMGPTLQVLSDGATRTRRELFSRVGKQSDLSDDQMEILLASGQAAYENRIGWALSFLTNVGALERPARGQYTITEAGQRLLVAFPNGMRERDVKARAADPTSGIREYISTTKQAGELEEHTLEASPLTPTEQVQDGIARIKQEVAADLLARLQDKEPEFFEQAVVDLLLAMGYGGTHGRGQVTSLTNDHGIDGVIDQDVLGLSRVYVQAKRYASGNAVQRPEVQGFVGALSGRADGGVFITTSSFTQGAVQYAGSVPQRIILIDGARLTDLMIRYGVGVQERETYSIVEIDEDFFA